jgi:hypothetical protein
MHFHSKLCTSSCSTLSLYTEDQQLKHLTNSVHGSNYYKHNTANTWNDSGPCYCILHKTLASFIENSILIIMFTHIVVSLNIINKFVKDINITAYIILSRHVMLVHMKCSKKIRTRNDNISEKKPKWNI